MNTDGLVLHETARQRLQTFVDAPSHAVLLTGAAGTGKSMLASRLAAALLAVSNQKVLAHPYFQIVEADKGTIKIEQIRSLIEFFRLKVPGHQAVQRVAMVQDADTMGHEAQNALLKLLEEPPAGSVVILTSSKPQTLLATIRSRTTILPLPTPDNAQLQAYFEQAGHAPAEVKQALLRSDGNIAEAARFLEAASTETSDSLEMVKKALSGSSYDRMLLVDPLSKKKDEAKQFVDDLMNVAVASLGAAASKGNPTARWQSVLQSAHTAQEALARSGNAKLVLSELMLSL